MNLQTKIAETVAYLSERISLVPEAVLILGSGMGSIAERIKDAQAISYEDIPHYTPSGAPSHAGQLVFGTLASRPVVCMQGRIHLYEGNQPQDVVYGIFVAQALGAKQLFMASCTGGIRADLHTGDIVAITDHINMTGCSPLFLNKDTADTYEAFVDMTDAYSPQLRDRAHQIAQHLGIHLTDGVYVATHGPQLETPAEIRAYQMWGADVVGMSTVLETIAARAVGMEVLCLAFVSNKAAGMGSEPISVAEIFSAAQKTADEIGDIICGLLAQE